jgi:hypothetical protein
MFALTLSVGLALGALGHHAVNAQQVPPTTIKDQMSMELASLDLGPKLGLLGGTFGHGSSPSNRAAPTQFTATRIALPFRMS